MLEIGKLHLYNSSNIETYPFLYHVPKRSLTRSDNTVHLIFHGSTIPNYKNGDYVPYSFKDQIHEIEKRTEQLYLPHLSENFIYLFIVRPRNFDSQKDPEYLYDSQAFTKQVMLKHFTDDNTDSKYKRPDLIVLKTIDLFRQLLTEQNIDVNYRVLISGGSAGAMAANRFTFLHPDRVLSLGLMCCGTYQLPTTRFKGIRLNYPFGLLGMEYNQNLINELKKIPIHIFIGSDDDSDPLGYELNGDKIQELKYKIILGNTPFKRAKEFSKFLIDNGISTSIHIFDGLKHRLPINTVLRKIENDFTSSAIIDK